MIRRLVVFGLLCALHCASALAGQDAAGEARALVEQLRDGDYDRRRAAAEKLAALGEAARPALDQALRSDDVETRAAAATLVRKLNTASVTLFAFDRDGQPAAGAEGELRFYAPRLNLAWNVDWSENPPRNVTVSSDGTAHIAGLPPGEGALQFIWQKRIMGRDSFVCHSLSLRRGDNPVFLTLLKNGEAEIKVQDANGAPLRDARVQLFTETHFTPELLDSQLALYEHWGQNAQGGLSGPDGVAKLEAAEGFYECVVRATGFLPCLAGTVRIAEGRTAKMAAVRLEPKNAGQLRLTLLKEDGEPLKKTRVNVQLDYQYAGPEAVRLRREVRQLKAQLSMRGRADQLETDEQGKVAVEDLRPGDYSLAVTAGYGADATWLAPEVAVAGGQAKELTPLKPAPTGSIEGRIRGPDNQNVRFRPVGVLPEEELVDGSSGVEGFSDLEFRMQRRSGGSRNTQPQADGRYVLKNLVPGRYAVCIGAYTNEEVLILGLEVSAGKATQAPDAVIPGGGVAALQEIKGIVLLPNGKPAERARVILYGAGPWENNCDDKGCFSFSRPAQLNLTGGRLIVKAAGCRPCCLDLAAPGLKFDNLSVQLEKQEYGSLRVKVADESGKPLSGATLLPRGARQRSRYARNPEPQRQIVTNANGEGRLTGLAAGARSLHVQCEDYCPQEDYRVAILPDAEAQVTVVLRKGLALSGRIEAPEAAVYAQTVVCLQSVPNRTSRVTAEGRFSFSGLAPGRYSLTASAPGLITPEPANVVLRLDAACPEPGLKLVRPCGVTISVDKGLAGCSASLLPKGEWGSPLSVRRRERWTGWAGGPPSPVDASGRAELWGMAPGEYDVLLTPDQNRFGRYIGYNQGYTPAQTPMQLVAGTVEARPLRSVAELQTLPAVVLKTETGSASVRGRLVCPKAAGENHTNVALELVGRAAVGMVHLGYPTEMARQDRRKPLIIGALPRGMQLEPPEPGTFAFQGVPPGEYKVWAEVLRYPSPSGRTVEEEPKPQATLLASVVVPAAGRVELGTLTLDLPASASGAEEAADDPQTAGWQAEMEPEDQVPIFQP